MINKSCSSVNWTVHLLFQQMHSSADMSTFSKLVWQRLTLLCPFPDKKDSFCQTVQSLSLSQADILQLLILRMVDRVKFKVPFSTCRGPNPDTLVYLSLCVVSAHRASNLCPFQDRSLSDPYIHGQWQWQWQMLFITGDTTGKQLLQNTTGIWTCTTAGIAEVHFSGSLNNHWSYNHVRTSWIYCLGLMNHSVSSEYIPTFKKVVL